MSRGGQGSSTLGPFVWQPPGSLWTGVVQVIPKVGFGGEGWGGGGGLDPQLSTHLRDSAKSRRISEQQKHISIYIYIERERERDKT